MLVPKYKLTCFKQYVLLIQCITYSRVAYSVHHICRTFPTAEQYGVQSVEAMHAPLPESIVTSISQNTWKD